MAVLGLCHVMLWRVGTCLEHEHHEGVGWGGSKMQGGENGGRQREAGPR